MFPDEAKIEIQHLTMTYGDYVFMRDINTRIKHGSVFIIMGESGTGKSTLLRHMIGLKRPTQGDVLFDGRSFWDLDEESRRAQLRSFGVLFQNGALWSSMTLAENVALPLAEYTDWPLADRQDVARLGRLAQHAYARPHQLGAPTGRQAHGGLAQAQGRRGRRRGRRRQHRGARRRASGGHRRELRMGVQEG